MTGWNGVAGDRRVGRSERSSLAERLSALVRGEARGAASSGGGPCRIPLEDDLSRLAARHEDSRRRRLHGLG
jgi:hypothetical protein